MIHYKGTITNINTVIYDISEDENPLRLENTTFQLAIEVSYIYNNQTVYLTETDSFLNLSIGQVIRTIDSQGNNEQIDFYPSEYSK